MKPTYRVVSLSLAGGWVAEVRRDDVLVHTTVRHEDRAVADANAWKWVRAQKTEKVRESKR